jgi:hypothetical protein
VERKRRENVTNFGAARQIFLSRAKKLGSAPLPRDSSQIPMGEQNRRRSVSRSEELSPEESVMA